MRRKQYIYIGKGEIKHIDSNRTVLGAFLTVNVDDLINALQKIKANSPDREEVLIYALPNQSGSYSVKIKTYE